MASVGKALCYRALQWQLIQPSDPTADFDRLPVIFIAGSAELNLDNDAKTKLRSYVEHGGLILGNADGGSKIFSSSFEKLGNELFPKYEFRSLPKSHVIMDQMYRPTKWKVHPEIRGLSNGVRELMLLIPDADLAQSWQDQKTKSHNEAFELAANIYLYAVGRNLFRGRSEGADVPRPHNEAKARTLHVARIAAGDNWNPEPGAWPRMADIMWRQSKSQLTADPIRLGAGKLAGYGFAHLTGTTKFALAPIQRAELKAFVDKGGTLLIDAAGGSTEFADSAERELKEIFGDQAAQLNDLSAQDKFFAQTGGLASLKKHLYRSFGRKMMTGNSNKRRLCVVVRDGRTAVFYSRDDLTSAMAGVRADGIVGYDVEAGTEIVSRMLLYAQAGGKF